MSTCHKIKEGDIYSCEVCGLALKVIKTCRNHDVPVEECENCGGQYQFSIHCCGTELKAKKQ